jgi:hypothetical protein
MRRRSLLVSIGVCLPGLGGCVGTGPGADATATESPQTAQSSTATEPPGTDAATPSGSAFESTVRDVVGDPIHFSRASGTWELEYPTSVTQGEPFETEQARIATAFSQYRPADVTLEATATHDCTTVDWRVSASLARAHASGETGDEAFLRRVRQTTERTNNC